MYSAKIGDLLVIMITSRVGRYIAEVTALEPSFRLKVTESDSLKDGDFIIRESDSEKIQADFDAIIKNEFEKGRPLKSGLAKLGVTDNKIHEILPTQT